MKHPMILHPALVKAVKTAGYDVDTAIATGRLVVSQPTKVDPAKAYTTTTWGKGR